MTEDDLPSSPNRFAGAGHVIDKVRPAPRRTADLFSRVLWLASAGAISLMLWTARSLAPDPRGFGTHTQLGLPGCFFLQLTGLPCPACGLTTCCAWLVRGELTRAFDCHPLGAVIFSTCCLGACSCVYAAVRGRAFFETWTRLRAARVCAGLACALLAQWLLRIAHS